MSHSAALSSYPSDDLDTCLAVMAMSKVFGNPGTDGTYMSNYRFFVVNKHPVLGIFMCHPLHPYSRVERVFGLFSVTMWSLFVAVLLDSVWYTTFEETWERVAINSALIIPVDIITYQLLCQPMCQNKNRTWCYKNKDRCSGLGHFVYAVIALASAFYLTMLVKLLKECGEDREDFRMGRAPRHDGGRTRPYADDECTTATVITETLEAKALNWFVLWFVTWTSVFYARWKWGGDRRWFYRLHGNEQVAVRDDFSPGERKDVKVFGGL
mmetsp:Transcript_2852/g.5263  ORF Transcript_2852/g.5263 Transcript_2852/m.5263 type:complete len:268 (+) Transcript_2852:232-1035(+)